MSAGDGQPPQPQPHPDLHPTSAERPADVGPAAVRRVCSDQLFAPGSAELLIDHRGVLYRLRQTALGKLILTK